MKKAAIIALILLLAACASQPVPTVPYETAHQTYAQGDYPLAVQQLQPLASAGDMRAERDLGLIYLTGGGGISYDYYKGRQLLEVAADRGDAQAQLEYGRLYTRSSPLLSYAQAAHQWYEKAAAQGLPDAEVEVGSDFLEGRAGVVFYPAALEWFNKAADAGNASARRWLGYMYFYGLGVPQDQGHGIAFYQQAAKAGDRKAELFLGSCYQDGSCGLAKDEAAARTYGQQASEGVVQNYSELAEAMKDIIDSHKVYPKESVAARQSGLVMVEFDCPLRTPENIEVTKSSGFKPLDAAAAQAVHDSYFPERVPALNGMTHFKIGVNFVYNLPVAPPGAGTRAAPAAATSH